MNQQTYIIIGISIFTFLIGLKLKKRFSKKPIIQSQHLGKQFGKKYKDKKSKADILDQQKNKNLIRKERWRALFLKIILVFLFFLVLFMIPAIMRTLMVSNYAINENIILRILILSLALMSLIAGFVKVFSKKNK